MCKRKNPPWEENIKTEVSIQALEESTIYTIKYEDFLKLLNAGPEWQEVYRQGLLRNYILKTKREIEFVQFNAKDRLIKFQNNKNVKT